MKSVPFFGVGFHHPFHRAGKHRCGHSEPAFFAPASKAN
jgi:hypothetical protein